MADEEVPGAGAATTTPLGSVGEDSSGDDWRGLRRGWAWATAATLPYPNLAAAPLPRLDIPAATLPRPDLASAALPRPNPPPIYEGRRMTTRAAATGGGRRQ